MVCLLAVREHGHYTGTCLLEVGTLTQNQGNCYIPCAQCRLTSALFVTAKENAVYLISQAQHYYYHYYYYC